MHVKQPLVLAASLAVLMGGTALAQEQASPLAMVRAIAPDVHALRYYAREGETDRFQLEMERLRLLYPGFQPPANLMTDDVSIEQELWDLYGEGQLDTLRARLAEMQDANPGWTPSEALSAALDRSTARGLLMEAYRSFDTGTVKTIANDNPLLINPDDPEVVWAIGETFAMEQDLEAAIQAFRFAVTTAQTREIKAGALQKTAQHLPTANASALHTLAKKQYADEGIGTELDIGFARGLVIRSNQFGHGFPVEYIDIINLYMQQAMANGWLKDIEILSWTLYNQKQYLPALALFQKSLDIQPEIKTVEGIILSLMQLERHAEARPIATQWRTSSPEIALLYLSVWAPEFLAETPAKLEAQFVQTYALTANDVSSGEGAEALGWYAYNVKQFTAADAWFSKAMEWEVTQTAVLGKMLTAAAVKDEALFDRIKAAYLPVYPELEDQLYQPVFAKARRSAPAKRSATRSQTLSNTITAAYEAKQYTRCVELSDQQIGAGRVGPRDYQMRGWCLMQLQRHAEAQDAFTRAVETDTGSGRDRNASAYGASLAALASGRTDNAYELASTNTMEEGQRRVVNKEILTQRAISAFRNQDYQSTLYALNELRKIAPEPRDLANLRGWSLYHLGDRRAAERVFQAINNTYSTPESRQALAAARGQTGRR